MTQIPPVGPVPSADVLLVGALLYGAPSDVAAVLELVADDDVESNALATVFGALRRLVDAGKPHGPQLVLDELRRTGELRRYDGVAGELQRATTSGADALAVQHYAAAVVGASLRRRVESYGVVLTTAAADAPEAELTSHVRAAIRVIGDCGERLNALRGES